MTLLLESDILNHTIEMRIGVISRRMEADMARRRRRLKMLMYYPLVLLLMACVTVVFALNYQGKGILHDVEASEPTPTPEITPEPTLEAPVVEITPPPEMLNTGRCIPYYTQGKWGYKNTSAQVVIPAQFSSAMEFDGDVAFAGVVLGGAQVYGLIDRQGRWLVEPVWENVKQFSEGMACVKSNAKWGYINAAGLKIVDTLYTEAYPFCDGLARIRLGGKYGYIDPKGELVIPNTYAAANDFSQARAFVVTTASGKERGLIIDTAGEEVADMKLKRGTIFSEDYAVLKMGAELYGYVTREGNTAFSATFERAMPFSEGLAAVRQNGKWGYINTRGEFVIEPQYADARQFSEGLAAVMASKDIRYAYIDAEGNEVIAAKYEEAEPFSGGCAIVKRGPEMRLIDTAGNEKLLYVGNPSSPVTTSKTTATAKATPSATPKASPASSAPKTPKPKATTSAAAEGGQDNTQGLGAE